MNTGNPNRHGVHSTRLSLLAISLAVQALLSTLGSVSAADKALPELTRPLSKVEALNLALANNGTIRQAQKEVEAAAGISIQTRAILFPKVTAGGAYLVRQDSLIEANRNRTIPPVEVAVPALPALGLGEQTLSFGGGETPKENNQSWIGDIRIVQSIYEGGRMMSAARSSRLIREQALLVFRSTVADTLLSVANAYDTALGQAKLVEVREQQVKFLTEYRDETKKRFEAGTVPEFDVIRQEVEVANGTAALVQAQGDYRVGKQRLVELLGYDLPTKITDNLPLNLTTPLVANPYRPRDHYEQNAALREVIDLIASGALGGSSELFRPIVENLLDHDPFLLLADYQAYIDAQDRVSALWRDPAGWTRQAILNSARMGKFSSDRSIRDYCERVWKVQPGPANR
jgi:outer membrane protein TolC